MGYEKFLYYWDYLGYYDSWKVFILNLQFDFVAAIKSLLHSIRDADYNLSSIFFIEPLAFFSNSRRTYILGISLLYLLPVVLLFSYCCRLFCSFKSKYCTCVILILAVTFVPFFGPTLRGYPDISGLIPIIGVIILLCKVDFSKQVSRYSLLVGALLWCPFLLRRWYAYTIISLYLSLPIFSYCLHNKSNYFDFSKIRIILLNFFVSGIVTLLLALSFQYKLLLRIITTNYSDIYSAYSSSLLRSVFSTFDFLGYFNCSLALISVCLVFLWGTYRQKLFLLFILFNLLFSFFCFTRTQSPGIQHVLPFSLEFLFIIALGIICVIEKYKFETSAVIFSVLFILMQFISLSPFFSLNNLFNIFPAYCKPLVLNRYDNYISFVRTLDNIVTSDKFVCFASSGLLNDSMLFYADNYRLFNKIASTSQVDKRDLMPINSFYKKYAVVTSVNQTHLRPEDQLVITVPNSKIINGIGIGKAYKKVGEPVYLAYNLETFLYEKFREFTEEEITDLLHEFYNRYPEWEQYYDQSVLKTVLSVYEIEKGDVFGGISFSDQNVLHTHPGDNSPEHFCMKNYGISSLNVRSTNTQCNIDDDILFRLNNNEFRIKHGMSQNIDVRNMTDLDIIVSKNMSSGCDSLDIYLEK